VHTAALLSHQSSEPASGHDLHGCVLESRPPSQECWAGALGRSTYGTPLEPPLSVVAWPVFVQERLRGWQCGSFFPGRRPYADSRVRLTGGRKAHNSRRGGVLSSCTPTALGKVLQCPRWQRGWSHRADDDRGDVLHWSDVTALSWASARQASVLFRGFRRPLSRVRRAGRTRVGSTVSRS
jgi:hypothetical protein